MPEKAKSDKTLMETHSDADVRIVQKMERKSLRRAKSKKILMEAHNNTDGHHSSYLCIEAKD